MKWKQEVVAGTGNVLLYLVEFKYSAGNVALLIATSMPNSSIKEIKKMQKFRKCSTLSMLLVLLKQLKSHNTGHLEFSLSEVAWDVLLF